MSENLTQTLDYTGWLNIVPTENEWIDIYTNKDMPKFLEGRLKENEYVIVNNNAGSSPLTYCFEKGKLRKFTGQSIRTFNEETSDENVEYKCSDKNRRKPSTKNKKYSKGKTSVINARNVEQACAIDLLKDREKTVKLITGTWGTGKTLLLVTAALEALKNGEFEKIIWIRNNIDVKDTKDLGALPGEVIDKLLPYLGPFIDHAGENAVRTMIEKEALVVEPLQSLRGRNFSNSIIMCSEAENLTKEHIQLIIARAAEGSEVWFDADNRQRDKAVFERSRGIETLVERFAGNELFGYVHLVKSERSKTAAMADLLN